MKFAPIILIILTSILLLRLFRKKIVKWLYRLRAKLKMQSLGRAIKEADKDKEKTNRKNMVVLNLHSGYYEPVQKRLLKYVAKKNKNKNNAAMTKGRRKMAAKPKTKTEIDTDRIKHIEKKSLYVTN